MGEVKAVIEQHFVQVRRIAQVLLLEPLDIAVQRLVTLHIMTLRVTLLQVIAQTIAGNQLADLILQGGRIGLQVLERSHGRKAEG
ncbi:hypothetical protein D9M71_546470 [compost metagenome]